MILSILVDTFISKISFPMQPAQRLVVSLTLNHRRKPTVGRADPPVVPVTDEISPNKNSQLIRGQAFRIVAVIEKLAFHSGPHAFTSSIIVAPATITVHALYNAIFRKRLTVGFTGILSSSVGVHNGTSQIRMRQIGIIQCMLTQSCASCLFSLPVPERWNQSSRRWLKHTVFHLLP